MNLEEFVDCELQFVVVHGSCKGFWHANFKGVPRAAYSVPVPM